LSDVARKHDLALLAAVSACASACNCASLKEVGSIDPACLLFKLGCEGALETSSLVKTDPEAANARKEFYIIELTRTL
jgi:hypothetical protein